MASALANLPAEQTAALSEALRVNERLVEMESPATRFIATEDGDIDKAALRLTKYWHERKLAFEDRAFHPLSQCGPESGGALNENEIEMLNDAFAAVLPNHSSGRPVLFNDVRREKPIYRYPPYIGKSSDRMVFYFFQVLSENPMAQSEGVIVIEMGTGLPWREAYEYATRMVDEALPIRTIFLHSVFLPSWDNRTGFFDNLVSWLYRSLGLYSKNMTIHRGDTDEEVVKNMVAAGFVKRSLPRWSLKGGGFDMKKFRNWQERRSRLELQRVMSKEELDRFRKQRNALYSRQQRIREMKAFEELEYRKKALREENQDLTSEEKRLTELLNSAMNAIKEMEEKSTSETPTEDITMAMVDNKATDSEVDSMFFEVVRQSMLLSLEDACRTLDLVCEDGPSDFETDSETDSVVATDIDDTPMRLSSADSGKRDIPPQKVDSDGKAKVHSGNFLFNWFMKNDNW